MLPRIYDSVRLHLPQPFRVLGLQQIAIGGLDKGELSALWEGVLGCTKTGSYVSEKENVDEDILTLGHGPYAVEVDLMQVFLHLLPLIVLLTRTNSPALTQHALSFGSSRYLVHLSLLRCSIAEASRCEFSVFGI